MDTGTHSFGCPESGTLSCGSGSRSMEIDQILQPVSCRSIRLLRLCRYGVRIQLFVTKRLIRIRICMNPHWFGSITLFFSAGRTSCDCKHKIIIHLLWMTDIAPEPLPEQNTYMFNIFFLGGGRFF
jgi:hypothetical protein